MLSENEIKKDSLTTEKMEDNYFIFCIPLKKYYRFS